MTAEAEGSGGADASQGTWSRRRFVCTTGAGAAVALGASPFIAAPASAAALPQCKAPAPGGPLRITPDCEDPDYNRPVIDREQDLTDPVPHRKVSGHFEGTEKRFTICLPRKSRWRGRFFHKVYPLTSEEPAPEDVAFGADSGAYTVQTNGGGGYRVDAAAARFSRTVAAAYYKAPHRAIHGYVYGGSGGSYQTIGAIENTSGVWDGAVPFIIGTPASMPNSFTVRALARLVLRDKAATIGDAVSPGGTGDPYAGLEDFERDILREATLMGVPLRAWEDYTYLLGLKAADGLLGLGALVRDLDPSYVDDFWKTPGYLGTEKSPVGDLIRAALIEHATTVTEMRREGGTVRLVLDSVPSGADTRGLDGTTDAGPLSGTLDADTKVFTLADGNDPAVVEKLSAGSRLRLDNRWYVALHAYHRHQIPTRPGLTRYYDQYVGPDGKPLHPQREVLVGPIVSASTSGGGTHTGKVNGKVIIVGTLLDTDAFPWPGDWYRTQVRQAMGEAYDDTFRLWFHDNADHLSESSRIRDTRLIDYTGILQQALRDVSAWAEDGTPPARTTSYEVADDSGIEVPSRARARLGIQPVVDLTVGGGDRIEIAAGRPVTFRARIEVPPGAGQVVRTAWDFTGEGTFTDRPFGKAGPTVTVNTKFTYTEPGTYLATLRAIAHREGDTETPFATVQNMGRVRVVVR